MIDKNIILSNIFCTLSVLMLIIMVVALNINHQNYIRHPEYSAPFSVYIIFNGIVFGIPTVISFVLFVIFRIKGNKK